MDDGFQHQMEYAPTMNVTRAVAMRHMPHCGLLASPMSSRLWVVSPYHTRLGGISLHTANAPLRRKDSKSEMTCTRPPSSAEILVGMKRWATRSRYPRGWENGPSPNTSAVQTSMDCTLVAIRTRRLTVGRDNHAPRGWQAATPPKQSWS